MGSVPAYTLEPAHPPAPAPVLPPPPRPPSTAARSSSVDGGTVGLVGAIACMLATFTPWMIGSGEGGGSASGDEVTTLFEILDRAAPGATWQNLVCLAAVVALGLALLVDARQAVTAAGVVSVMVVVVAGWNAYQVIRFSADVAEMQNSLGLYGSAEQHIWPGPGVLLPPFGALVAIAVLNSRMRATPRSAPGAGPGSGPTPTSF